MARRRRSSTWMWYAVGGLGAYWLLSRSGGGGFPSLFPAVFRPGTAPGTAPGSSTSLTVTSGGAPTGAPVQTPTGSGIFALGLVGAFLKPFMDRLGVPVTTGGTPSGPGSPPWSGATGPADTLPDPNVGSPGWGALSPDPTAVADPWWDPTVWQPLPDNPSGVPVDSSGVPVDIAADPFGAWSAAPSTVPVDTTSIFGETPVVSL